jgi:uncharacterized protein (DUF427 family)
VARDRLGRQRPHDHHRRQPLLSARGRLHRVSGREQQATCPWKGEASYCDVIVGGDRNEATAWYYPEPSDAAAEIRDHVAFWNGIETDAV